MDMVRVRIQEISVFGKFPKSDIIEIVCVCACTCAYVFVCCNTAASKAYLPSCKRKMKCIHSSSAEVMKLT